MTETNIFTFDQSQMFCFLTSESQKTLPSAVQLRGNQKDVTFQLHHRLSKFEVPVVVNLKHIFELFGLYTTCFLIQKLWELIRLSSDGQFWRKSQTKKGGKFELRSQLCYYNCIQYYDIFSSFLCNKIKLNVQNKLTQILIFT